MSPSRAASTALSSETASQGWATAVAMAGCLLGALRSGARTWRAAGRAGRAVVRHWPPSTPEPRASTPNSASIRLRRRGLPRASAPRAPTHAAAGRRARSGAASLAVGQQPGNGAHGALLVEADEQELVLQTVPSARPCSCGRSTGCMARIACSVGEAALVDAALRAGGRRSGRGARASGRPPTSKRARAPPRMLCLVGLAHQIALDAPRGRRMLGAQPDHAPAAAASRRCRGTSPRSWRRAPAVALPARS